MSVSRVRVRNFQSLRDVDLALGKLTVVVGASNSGKSALLRAIRTVARNAASPAFVTQGERAAHVEVWLGPHAVTLERGKSLSTYRILRDGDDDVFTKCGTQVPPQVEQVLGMTEIDGDWLNFATQFDKPFLLDAPATSVAKTLGDLTNIDILYEAVREANRLRLGTNQKLKVREEDVEKLRTRVSAYTGLKERKARVEKATALLGDAEALGYDILRLQELVEAVVVVQSALSRLKEELPQVPDLSEVEARVVATVRLESLLRTVQEQVTLIKGAKAGVLKADEALVKLDSEYHESLREAGECPVCGQNTKGV